MKEIEPILPIFPTNNPSKNFPLPKPFEQDIFLFQTHIAGTTYIDDREAIEKNLQIDDKLNFYREPNNPYDSGAIVIKTNDNLKIGYVPKKDNIVFSRLMDAGKLLYGKVKSIEKIDDWLKVIIDIYLHE